MHHLKYERHFWLCIAVYCLKQRIKEWTYNCILRFSKKGDLEIIKNYRDITLITIAVRAKNLIDFCKCLEEIYRGKIKQARRAYSLFKETVTAIMMLYKNTKTMDCSRDEDTDF